MVSMRMRVRPGCPPVPRWCTDKNSTLSRIDCDGDGQLDWACTDPQGRQGTVLSSQDCYPSWPMAGYKACPKLFKGACWGRPHV